MIEWSLVNVASYVAVDCLGAHVAVTPARGSAS
jgi:hypothetical protein